MGILSKLISGYRAFRADNSEYSRGSIEQVIREVFASSPAMSGENVNASSAMRVAAVYACVRVLSESVSQVPLILYRRDGSSKVREPSHPASVLMNVRPNRWQTAFEFRELMMGHACLRGNAYAYKAGAGRFMQLIPIHPDRITVSDNLDGSPRYTLSGSDGTPSEVPADRLLHIRGPFGGASPIEAFRETVGVAMATQRHQAKLFANGAKFHGFLKHPGKLSGDAGKRLRESFDAEHGGKNSFKTPLLEEGLDYVKVGMTSEDSQTIETYKMTRSEIASIFRVPPHMIGDLDRATFSNIEHQSIQFVTQSVMPWWRRWELALSRDLLSESERDTYYFEHLAEGLLRGDTATRYQAYGLAIRDGWMSRNEVRERENLDEADGLNEFLVPLNMTNPQGASGNADPNQKQQ